MIEVIRCGVQTTVQDLGRVGLRHWGIAQCGAMDPLALQHANLLLGNAQGAAALELSVGPLVLCFHKACRIVLTGVDFSAYTVDADGEAQTPLLPGHPATIGVGMSLHLPRPAIPGARAYLAFSGGINVPKVLGSRSTDLAAGFGGYYGRALQTGDTLPLGRERPAPVHLPYGIRSLAPSHVLRALPGPDYDAFSEEAHHQFWMLPWRITHQSNRMGLRLNGGSLALRAPLDLLSSGVLPGDVQVPPDGLPIVLANDAQTLGGYPRIARVIQADLWQLAHMPPLTSVYFQPVTHALAVEALQKQQRAMDRLAETLSGH